MTDLQTIAIEGWRPEQIANSSHGHWSVRQKKLSIAQATVWAAAMQAGWRFVPGRVRLTITLVFAQERRRDTDNLYARVKGCVDGLRTHRVRRVNGIKLPRPVVRLGWFSDDSADVLDLVVKAEVSREWNGTRITLESL
jgi:hypothetical protein